MLIRDGALPTVQARPNTRAQVPMPLNGLGPNRATSA